MDIYETLKQSGESMYVEDLDYLETELATNGEYTEEYKAKCKLLIDELRNWKRENSDEYVPSKKRKRSSKGKQSGNKLIMSISELGAPNSVSKENIEELMLSDIFSMRKAKDYKKLFKEYINAEAAFDEKFIDAHFSTFRKPEMAEILAAKSFSEEFLEKYFDVLDHKQIAKHQLFSEGFFIKHFNELDAEIVIKKGKNEWVEKEKRSAQLDVFLRLGGVKI